MPLITYGVNHQTAALNLREQLAVTPQSLANHLAALYAHPAVNEAVLLSTCNRTEIIAVADEPLVLPEWLANIKTISLSELESSSYFYQDIDAVKHLLRVSCGLDSMVLGEPQIFGQMKQAYQAAVAAGTVGRHLQHVFQATFATSKAVRHDTRIGYNSVTMPFAIIKIAKQIFSDIKKSRVLFIGAGETIELAATHCEGQGMLHPIIANRSLAKAEALATRFHGQAIQLADIPQYLPTVDIVVAATNSDLPILGKGAIEAALQQRKHRPFLLVDLAMPRDIESQVAQLEDVYLYNLDDLQTIIAQNLSSRETAAQAAEDMIELKAQHYFAECQLLDAGHVIKQYRQDIETLRDECLSKAMLSMEQKNPQVVLTEFAQEFTNKLLHAPTLAMRQAAEEGKLDLLQQLQTLLRQNDSN